MSTTDLSQRYGTHAPTSRRWVVGAVAALVLLFGGWLAWVTVVQADPDVASGNLTWDDEATTDNEITGSFTVDIADDVVEATCTLKALAKDRTTVGSLTFTVPRGTTRVEQAVATERKAVSLELLGCTAPGQNRPR
ncbi:MAG: hypothetical protein JWN84_2242 [Nocardioides sp.]|nr:hypothetical protein [Nocardioides sp.]